MLLHLHKYNLILFDAISGELCIATDTPDGVHQGDHIFGDSDKTGTDLIACITGKLSVHGRERATNQITV